MKTLVFSSGASYFTGNIIWLKETQTCVCSVIIQNRTLESKDELRQDNLARGCAGQARYLATSVTGLVGDIFLEGSGTGVK